MLKFIEKRDIMEQVNLPERGERLEEHGIRGLLILALIWALIGAAWAEEMLPASIREAQSLKRQARCSSSLIPANA